MNSFQVLNCCNFLSFFFWLHIDCDLIEFCRRGVWVRKNLFIFFVAKALDSHEGAQNTEV
jgi:hypothetical protein